MEQTERDGNIIMLFEKLLNDADTEVLKTLDIEWKFTNRKILKDFDIKYVRFSTAMRKLYLGKKSGEIEIHTKPKTLDIIFKMIQKEEQEQSDDFLRRFFEKYNEDLRRSE